MLQKGKAMSAITSFSGEYYFLSNFFPCMISYDRIVYPSTEHAFQAAKTHDNREKLEISEQSSPGKAKKLGRKVSRREDWDAVKLSIMHDVVKIKFDSNPELKDKLIETFPHQLVEGNTWRDTYWGVCNGCGENHLGKILMEIREEFITMRDKKNEAKDPKRIEVVLRVVKKYWEDHPNLRLGQIICNAAENQDAFYLEDDVLSEWLQKRTEAHNEQVRSKTDQNK